MIKRLVITVIEKPPQPHAMQLRLHAWKHKNHISTWYIAGAHYLLDFRTMQRLLHGIPTSVDRLLVHDSASLHLGM